MVDLNDELRRLCEYLQSRPISADDAARLVLCVLGEMLGVNARDAAELNNLLQRAQSRIANTARAYLLDKFQGERAH